MILKSIFLIAVSVGIGAFVINVDFGFTSLLWHTLTAISITALFYIVFMLFLGLVHQEEIKRIPWVGEKLHHLLPRK